MTSTVASANPFVGPRTFAYADRKRYFGREREARDLLALVGSQRLVLFYAPSGAGKSSLINTRLAPQLQEKGLFVLPVARVTGELPAGVDNVENIFLFNLMLSLDQGHDGKGGDPGPLKDLSLNRFLTGLTSEEGQSWYFDPSVASGEADRAEYTVANTVLIIDQFEEIITTHSDRWQERDSFFTQLDQVMLADPHLRVVLSLREDYVAALDPYAHLLTDKLRARFHMQRMGVDAALEAVEEPSGAAGRPFAAGVAEQLVNNLRLTRVAGQEGLVPGQYVEPVQLQVVCYQLWEKLGDRPAGSITAEDLTAAGDVEESLAAFYEMTVADVAADGTLQTSEQQLRAWFSDKLITQAGTRSTVYRDEQSGETGGLSNAVVAVLARRFLVRVEPRAGGEWVELVHDRFVEPLLASNRAWSVQHLSAFQRQAALWHDEGRPVGLLLQGDALQEAEDWLAGRDGQLQEYESEFLAACREAQQAAAREARQNQRIRLLAIVAVVFSVLAVAAALFAWDRTGAARESETVAIAAKSTAVAEQERAENAAREAERQKGLAETQTQVAQAQREIAEAQAALARARQLSAESSGQLAANRPELATLLALKALSDLPNTTEAESALRSALQDWRGEGAFREHDESVYGIYFAPTGDLLATSSNDDTARLWSLETMLPTHILNHAGDLTGLVFSPDATRVATSSRDNTVRIWDVASGELLHDLDHVEALDELGFPTEEIDGVRSIVLSPDGRTIATRVRRYVMLWDLETGELIDATSFDDASDVRTIAFSPDGDTVLVGTQDGFGWLWHLPTDVRERLSEYDGAVVSAFFAPDGRTFVTRSENVLRIDEIDEVPEDDEDSFSVDNIRRIQDGTKFTAVSNSPDGRLLVVGSSDGFLRVWRLESPVETPDLLVGHEETITGIGFSRDGRLMASTSFDNNIRIWRADSGELQVLLVPGSENVYSPTFSPDGSLLFTADQAGNVRRWRTQSGANLGYYLTHMQPATSLSAISRPDGEWIGVAGESGLIELWQPTSGAATAYRAGDARLDALASTQDGAYLLVGSTDGRIHVLDAESGDEVAAWDAHANGVRDLVVLPDSDLLASAGGEGDIKLWQWRTGKSAGELMGHGDDVNALTLSADGETLYSGSADGTVWRWNWRDGSGELLVDAAMPLLALDVSDDGKWLAAGGYEPRVLVWSLKNPNARPRSLPHNDGNVRTLLFDRDGRLLSGDESGVLRIWPLESAAASAVATEAHPGGRVADLVADGDGRVLYSVGGDGFLRAWPMTTADLLAAACRRLPRSLTDGEWRDFVGEEAQVDPCTELPAASDLAQVAVTTENPDAAGLAIGDADLPVIHYFESLSGSSIKPGEEVILRWDVSNANGVWLDYGGRERGQIGTGTKTVRDLAEDETFRLITRRGNQERIMELTVRVEDDQ